MLNKVVLIGRLTRDPELRSTANGVSVATFSLAVDRPFTNKQGERETDFIRIVTWRRLAEVCAENLGKGRLVAVAGRLQVRSYDNQEGQRRTIAEVVADEVKFLERPRREKSETSSAEKSEFGVKDIDNDDFGDELDFDDEDLPFM